MAHSILIAGPTAVGKSSLAIELAKRIHGEIISVDSIQVYQGLDIGTAKPSLSEQQEIPHHLIDIATLDESFDVQQFVEQASAARQQIEARNRPVIFCGGTGLYFRGLLEGLDHLPATNPYLRKELEQTPLPELLKELESTDPVWFQQIDQENPRRVIRALEIIRLTGQPVSTQRTTWNEDRNPDRPTLFVLDRSTAGLRQRIDTRVDQMFARGLVEETRSLLDKGLRNNPSAKQSLGYRQVIDFLDGQQSLKDTIALVKTKTWQFAKRQRTWFRKQAKTHWIDLDQTNTEACLEQILT